MDTMTLNLDPTVLAKHKKPRNAYVTRRDAPVGYVAVTRPYAQWLFDYGVAVTLCGNNVNAFHVFDGWHLGHTVQQQSTEERFSYFPTTFEQHANAFLFYLESELGKYTVFYVTKENLIESDTK